MKKILIVTIASIFVILAATGFTVYSLSSARGSAAKPVTRVVQSKVEFENSHVKVVRYHFAPRAATTISDVSEVVTVWLTDAHINLTLPDGTVVQENHRAGAVAWSAPRRYTEVNSSDHPLEFISVQIKSSTPHQGSMRMDDGAMVGVQIKVEFANDHLTVLRYHFAPHATVPIHDAPELVAVWLTDAHIKLTLPDGTAEVENYPAGATEWEAPQRHTGENLSDNPLEFISIQLQGVPGGMQH